MEQLNVGVLVGFCSSAALVGIHLRRTSPSAASRRGLAGKAAEKTRTPAGPMRGGGVALPGADDADKGRPPAEPAAGRGVAGAGTVTGLAAVLGTMIAIPCHITSS